MIKVISFLFIIGTILISGKSIPEKSIYGSNSTEQNGFVDNYPQKYIKLYHLDNPNAKNSDLVLYNSSNLNCPGEINDIDGNRYKTVVIGDECWFKKNLRVSRFKNGDKIQNIRSGNTWKELNNLTVYGKRLGAPESPHAWAYYKNNEKFNESRGKLYNWHAATDSRGICPNGWRVPNDEDFKDLEETLGLSDPYYGSIESEGRKKILISSERGKSEMVGSNLKAQSNSWKRHSGVVNENSSGFSAEASNMRYAGGAFGFRKDGQFVAGDDIGEGEFAGWWSTSSSNVDERKSLMSGRVFQTQAWALVVRYDSDGVFRYSMDYRTGLSIRCIME